MRSGTRHREAALKGSVDRPEDVAVAGVSPSRGARSGTDSTGASLEQTAEGAAETLISAASRRDALPADDEPGSLSALKELLETPERNDRLAQSGAEALPHAGAEERLRRSEEQLRRLAGYLIAVREEERRHIAREIHDELGQVLTGLKMDVAWLAKRLRADQRLLREKTESISRLIDAAVLTVRKIAAGLRPEVLDNMGLVAAVGWQAREFQKRTGIRCQLKLPPETTKLGSDPSLTAFRIFQEILTNVARHSRATRVDISLEVAKDRLSLEVADNGVGISAREVDGKESFGLLGMRERALLLGGEVKISSAPGQGTKVVMSIPI